MNGKVYLVGAGPGDPELLTLKAARILANADVVLHDSLVSQEILKLVSPGAEVIHVGKRYGKKLLTQEEINSVLVHYARTHGTVVRLKGGDPLIFGRAAEEIDALHAAGIPFEVVPGITAALAAAAGAGISLTDRRSASQVLFTTAHRQTGKAAWNWKNVDRNTTFIVYMPGNDYVQLGENLMTAGLEGDTPCAVVSSASLKDQSCRWTTVACLGNDQALPAPALVIVGRVARSPLTMTETGIWEQIRGSFPVHRQSGDLNEGNYLRRH